MTEVIRIVLFSVILLLILIEVIPILIHHFDFGLVLGIILGLISEFFIIFGGYKRALHLIGLN
jgi:hypothetical protein